MSTIVEQNSFIKQTALLVLKYIVLKKRMIYGGLAVMIGFLIISILLTKFFTTENQIFGPLLFSTSAILITYGGYAFSSTMFNELNSSGSATQFLTLPASALQKLIAAWFVSFVAYTAVGVAAIYILSKIIDTNVISVPITASLPSLYTYIVMHSIFLFGAVYFKTNNFLATVVAMLFVFIALSLTFLVLSSFMLDVKTGYFNPSYYINETKHWVKILITTIISLTFLSLTYLRLKNRQIA
ncbi:MAG: hypothetical protein WC967_07610 [Balneolaceae bacterium]